MSKPDVWEPLSLSELKILFSESSRPYWISGGWALDLFIGRTTRPHEDLDVTINRNDLPYFQTLLSTWDLQIVDPPNSKNLRPLFPNEFAPHPYYNIWARKGDSSAWNIQFMLCDFDRDEWVYRRNGNIRGPFSEFEWTDEEGTKILSPVIQLLYKSRNPRDKDLQDLENCLPLLRAAQKSRLLDLIKQDSGDSHPWIKRIVSNS